MKNNHLIIRYEHHHFRGWMVATKRLGKRYVRYFSDKPQGRAGRLTSVLAERAIYRNNVRTGRPLIFFIGQVMDSILAVA